MAKRNLLVVFLLTVVTLGIYVPIWFLLERESLNKMKSDVKISRGLCFTNLLLWISLVVIRLFLMDKYMEIIVFITIAGIIIYYLLLTQARTILMDHYKKYISIIWTVILPPLQLQKVINDHSK